MAAQADFEREIYGIPPAGVLGERLQDAVVQALWPNVCHASSDPRDEPSHGRTDATLRVASSAHDPTLIVRARIDERDSNALESFAVYVVTALPREPWTAPERALPSAPEPRRLTNGS